MATVKNFGLAGVSADVQYGKGNGRIKYNTDHFEIRNAADAALIETYGATPTGSSDVNTLTTKEYVDSVAAGLDPKESVIVSTVEPLVTTFPTGAVIEAGTGVGHTLTQGGVVGGALVFTIDGITPTIGQRILIKDEVAQENNGIYTITTLGVAGSVLWVLTRATDFDGTPSNEVSGGAFTFIESGTTLADTGWVVSSPTGNAVVDTTNIVWTQFSAAGLISVSGTGGEITVVQTGNDYAVSIDNAYIGQTSITTLGTITSGTWNGTTVAVADGGTGQTVADDITNIAGARITVTGGLTSVFNGGTNVTLDVNEANLALVNIGGSLDLTTQVSGILPVPNGGTGLATITSNGIMFGSGAAAVSVTAAGAEGQLLRAGAAGTPAFTTATFPATVAASATSASILVANTSNTVTELTAVAAGGDQLLQFNSVTGNMEYVTTASVGGFKFSTISGDTGSAVADAVADTITMVGGAGITTVGASTPDTVTFDMDTSGLTVLTGATLNAAVDLFFVDDGATGSVIATATAQSIVDAATINVFTTISGDLGTGAVIDSETEALNFSGGVGVKTTVTDVSSNPDVLIELDVSELPAAVPVSTDSLIFADAAAATPATRAISSFLTDFAIVVDGDFASQGIMTSDGAGVYSMRSIVESTTAGQQGAQVNNGTATANIEIGVDINNLAAGTTMDATDKFIVFDGINNTSMTGQNIIDGVLALGNDDRIVSPDTFTTAVVDDTGKFVVSTENVATTGSNTFATFDTTVDALQFNFTNAAGEIGIQAGDAGGFGSGSTGNVDIRFTPGLNGEVIFGAAGTDATLTSASGTAGENFVILAGDGSAGNGGNITLTPGTGTGTDGSVCITDDDSLNVMCFNGAPGVALAVNYMEVVNAVTGSAPTFTATGTDANIDIVFLPKATGVLSVAGTTNYEVNVTADDDIPNKKYVDDNAASALAGAIGSFKFTVPLNALANIDPALSTIPAGATVLRVLVNVTVASDAVTTVTIGTIAGGAEYADATTNDPQVAGLYNADLMSATVGALRAVVGGVAGTVGSADVVVEYKNA